MFPFDDDTVPLPPVGANQAVQRVTAMFDDFARVSRPEPGFAVRPREDALVDAKAVDERLRQGERLSLAGTVVAAPENALLRHRLARAGAVVVGTTQTGRTARIRRPEGADRPGYGGHESSPEPPAGADAAVVTGNPPTNRGEAVVFVPTPGLVPGVGRLSVPARDVEVGQRVAAALTGPHAGDPDCRDWPDWTRLSAGQHPRVAVPDGSSLNLYAAQSRRRLAGAADTLRACGAVVEEVDLAGAERVTGPAAVALREHDALVLPWAERAAGARLAAELDAAAVALPEDSGVGVLTKAFDDQVALDLAGLLTGTQAAQPYPEVGVDLVAFGAYFRGQPRHGELTRVAARFAGLVTTSPRYRMAVLRQDPPEAGVVPAERSDPSAALVAERWLVSPGGLGEFAAHLGPPMRLGGVELADGSCVLGVLCDSAVAEHSADVTSWGCWRAYLRHLSTQRPSGNPREPASTDSEPG